MRRASLNAICEIADDDDEVRVTFFDRGPMSDDSITHAEGTLAAGSVIIPIRANVLSMNGGLQALSVYENETLFFSWHRRVPEVIEIPFAPATSAARAYATPIIAALAKVMTSRNFDDTLLASARAAVAS